MSLVFASCPLEGAWQVKGLVATSDILRGAHSRSIGSRLGMILES